MSRLYSIRSQVTTVRLFRPFFRPDRLIGALLRRPLDRFGDGRAGRFPLAVDMKLTTRCDQACAFCYNRENRVRQADELSHDEIVRLADECRRYRAGIFLTGGEPACRDDLDCIAASLHGRGVVWGLVTSGAGLDQATIGRLATARPGSVVVSLHGIEPTHDRLTVRRGSYQRGLDVLRRFSRALSAPGPIVNFVLTPVAANELPELHADVSRIGNVVLRLAHQSYVTPAEWAAHEREFRRRFADEPPRLLQQIQTYDAGAFEQLGRLLRTLPFSRLPAKPVLSPAEFDAWYAPVFSSRRRCTFIWHSTEINADGVVYPCQYHAIPMGSLRERPLAEIWNGERYRAFRRMLREGLLPGCARCCKL